MVARGRQQVRLEGDLRGVSLDYILLGVRLVQFLEVWQREMAEEVARHEAPARDAIGVGEFCDFAVWAFGYKRAIVMAALEELCEFQIVEFGNPNLNVPSRSVEDNVVISLPKMRHLEKHCLFDLAYLNMAAMRIPLPDSAFDGVPYFHAASYEEDEDELVVWVWHKVTNALGLLRLVTEVDRGQQALLASRIQAEGVDDFWLRLVQRARESRVLGFSKEMREAIVRQCELAVAGMQVASEELRRFQKHLEAYERAWPSVE